MSEGGLRNPMLAARDQKVQLEIAMLEQDIAKGKLELAAAERDDADERESRIRHGRFMFLGEVAEVSVHSLMAKIDHYLGICPGGDVEIILNSAGGSVVDGLALVDYFEGLALQGVKVTVIATGLCASMAAVILASAPNRAITKRGWIGVHEIRVGHDPSSGSSLTHQQDALKMGGRLQDQCTELLTSRSKLTARRLKNMWERKDAYLSAEEALKEGLVDFIAHIN